MGVPVVALTNRKDLYLTAALESLGWLDGWDELVIVDDSGDSDWRAHLAALCDRVVAVGDKPNSGFSVAMGRVWRLVRESGWSRWFGLEEDFRLNGPLDLAWLGEVMDASGVTQAALQRQAWHGNDWYDAEQAAGGMLAHLLNVFPGRLHERAEPHPHVTHDIVWTTNPALWSARATGIDWPSGWRSEQVYAKRARRAGHTAAFWGHPGAVTCTHVGEESSGTLG